MFRGKNLGSLPLGGGAVEAVVDRGGPAVVAAGEFDVDLFPCAVIQRAQLREEPAGDPAQITAGVEPTYIRRARRGRTGEENEDLLRVAGDDRGRGQAGVQHKRGPRAVMARQLTGRDDLGAIATGGLGGDAQLATEDGLDGLARERART